MPESVNITQFTRSIYEPAHAHRAEQGIRNLLEKHAPLLSVAAKKYGKASSPAGSNAGSVLPLDEKDAFVITYGDSFLLGNPPEDPAEEEASQLGVAGGMEKASGIKKIAAESKRHLRALKKFAQKYLKDLVSGIHILPFFPYSSDDGFSIADYYAVNPDIGNWDDIRAIAGDFKLMADLVLNHCSARGQWFQAFLSGNPEYAHYFIDMPENSDLSQVVRPRTHPLLSKFSGKDENGLNTDRHIWTTFSADQVDLNFGHPDVLVQMIDAMLFFIENGAQVIRLDAIAYLWKELGTPCIHHQKTHLIVQLYREILNAVAPWVLLITETNVPHQENMSYVGNGLNEAHMIYQFTLPPLLFDAFLRGNARHLTEWARSIPSGAPGPTGFHSSYFNFCASHDGVGVTPTHGILSDRERQGLVDAVVERGGKVSYKSTPNGKIPYELNINYLSAIADADLPQNMRVHKFLASQAILLSVAGVPGIYIHSIIGSENWNKGVELTAANRSINRQKLYLDEVSRELDTSGSFRNQIYCGYKRMLQVRRRQKAFHPAGKQVILEAGSDEIFAVKREAQNGQVIICLINTSEAPAVAQLNEALWKSSTAGKQSAADFYDLLSEKLFCSSLHCFDEADSPEFVASGDRGAASHREAASSRGDPGEKVAVLKLAPWEVLWLEVRK